MNGAPKLIGTIATTLRVPSSSMTISGVSWWPSFRGVAEASPLRPEELSVATQRAISDASGVAPMFVSLEQTITDAFSEPRTSPTLTYRVESRGNRIEIMVSLDPIELESTRAMAVVQGGLAAILDRVQGSRVELGKLGPRVCMLHVESWRTSFRDRVSERGLADDLRALGVDLNQLADLADASLPKGERRGKHATDLGARYSLTPTEARVAAELAAGKSLPDVAKALRMSHATARVHLKHIFSKLEVRTQASLVAKLLGVEP